MKGSEAGGMSRRDFLKKSSIGLAGVALLGATGCGEGQSSNEKGTVIFSSGPDPSGTLEGLIKQFNQQSGGDVKAELRVMPADTGQYFDKLRTQLQGGGGDIDVIAGDISWPAQLASNGWLADLSARFTEDERQAFLPSAVSGGTYEGKVYGVPWFWDSGLLYYRKDLLEKGGFSQPPGTWDELQEMAGKIQKDSATQFGYVFQGARYEGGTVNGLEYIRTSGGDVLEGNNVTVTSPEAVRGLEIERRNVTTGVTPASVASYKEDESAGAFLNGNAVFLRNWAYVYGLLADPEESRIKTDQVGIAQLPVAEQAISRVNVGGGWSFFINEASDKQDEAWKFVQFMAAPEQQKRWSIGGSYLPTRPALYEDEDILKTMPVIGRAKDAIRNTTTPPVSPYYADMSLAMSEQFNASLKGDVTPEQAAENLHTKLEDIIQRGG